MKTKAALALGGLLFGCSLLAVCPVGAQLVVDAAAPGGESQRFNLEVKRTRGFGPKVDVRFFPEVLWVEETQKAPVVDAGFVQQIQQVKMSTPGLTGAHCLAGGHSSKVAE